VDFILNDFVFKESLPINQQSNLGEIYIFFSGKQQQFKRNFQKIQNLASNIGGIISICYMIFEFIVNRINKYMLKLALFNCLLENENDTLKNTNYKFRMINYSNSNKKNILLKKDNKIISTSINEIDNVKNLKKIKEDDYALNYINNKEFDKIRNKDLIIEQNENQKETKFNNFLSGNNFEELSLENKDYQVSKNFTLNDYITNNIIENDFFLKEICTEIPHINSPVNLNIKDNQNFSFKQMDRKSYFYKNENKINLSNDYELKRNSNKKFKKSPIVNLVKIKEIDKNNYDSKINENYKSEIKNEINTGIIKGNKKLNNYNIESSIKVCMAKYKKHFMIYKIVYCICFGFLKRIWRNEIIKFVNSNEYSLNNQENSNKDLINYINSSEIKKNEIEDSLENKDIIKKNNIDLNIPFKLNHFYSEFTLSDIEAAKNKFKKPFEFLFNMMFKKNKSFCQKEKEEILYDHFNYFLMSNLDIEKKIKMNIVIESIINNCNK